MNRCRTSLFPLLAVLLWVLLIACGDKKSGDDGTTDDAMPTAQSVVYRTADTASVAGEIGVPAGVDAFGITVFAEGTSHAAYTDSEGRYVLSGLAAGEYRLRAMRPDLEALLVGDLTVADGDIGAVQPFHTMLRVIMDSRTGHGGQGVGGQFGSLVGQASTLIPGDEDGIVVSLEGTRHRTVTIGGGQYELLNIEPGSYMVTYGKAGYETVRQSMRIEAGREVEAPPVQLGSEAAGGTNTRTVFGRVNMLTADGSNVYDYGGVRVFLEGTNYSATPDSSGRFEFRNMPPGRYLIGASATDYLLEQKFSLNLESVPAVEVELVLLEDTTMLVEQGTLFGRALLDDGGPNGNAGIAVSVAGTSSVAFTDAAGNWEIYNLDPGTRDIVFQFDGYETAYLNRVNVTAGDPIEIEDVVLEKKVDRPRVVYTNPSDGASPVTIEEPTIVMIQFSEAMDLPSVLDAISISPEVSYRLGASRSGFGAQDTIELQLAAVSRASGAILKYDTRYTINIAGTARSNKGVAMEDEHEFSFTTGEAMIIQTDPPDDGKDFSMYHDSPIRVFFNAPIDRETLTRDDIEIEPDPPSTPNIYFREDPDTGWSILYISAYGNPDERYTVKIRKGVRTIGGDRVKNTPYSFRFTTKRLLSADEVYGTGRPGYDRNAREGEEERRR